MNNNTIYLLTGRKVRPCWLHNRDWNFCIISDHDGMQIHNKQCEFVSHDGILKYKPSEDCGFNHKGPWQQDNAELHIRAFQKWLCWVKNETQHRVVFDLPCGTFAGIQR